MFINENRVVLAPFAKKALKEEKSWQNIIIL